MMRKAVVDEATGRVVNVIVADDSWKAPAGHVLLDAVEAQPGDTWNGRGFIRAPQIRPVPREVTPRQIRLALDQMGLLDAVETAVAGAGKSTRIAWEYSTGIERDASLVKQMATAIGKTDADIDALFTLAAGL